MTEGEYELWNDAIFKIVPTCHAERDAENAIILTVPRQRNSNAVLARVRIWWQQSRGGGYASWSTFAGVYGQQHHRLTSYFSPFFPGATRAPRASQRGSSSWGHSAQPQTLLLAQAFAKRQQARVLFQKGKNEGGVFVCVSDGMNGSARSLVFPSPAFAVAL